MDIFSASSADPLLVYLPEDLKQKIEAELPRLERDIERKVEVFANELAKQLETEVFQALREQDGRLSKLESELAGKVGELSSAAAAAQVVATAKELQAAVQRYKEEWTGIGTKMRTVALSVLKGAGIPIPNI